MSHEERRVYYDSELELEAYQLFGIVQKFPNHFHDYYVIGTIERGRRHVWCGGQEYDSAAGDLILFNPRDSHHCAPLDGETLDYRAVNIPPETMRRAVRELTGQDDAPHFTQNLVPGSDLAPALRTLYDSVVRRAPRLEREEALYFLLESVLTAYAVPQHASGRPEPDARVQKLCAHLEAHFAENISLDELAALAGCGKSYLLRFFTRQVGVSPYRYLQTVRLGRAKRFLEQGVRPAEAAAQAGFADQSHFTNFFKEFIGLTPGQYQRIFTEPREGDPHAKK